MGCLNSGQGFGHWFGNIHLSGPCNRSCYFCIGQHMMELDLYNVLDRWPLPNIDELVEQCTAREVGEVYLTGTNTDPLLYQHHRALTDYLRERMGAVRLGLRTNAVKRSDAWELYDKASVTICSFDGDTYRRMMGQGSPPDLGPILDHIEDIKVNIVLGPENVDTGDIFDTLERLDAIGVTRVNLREPYGQPRVGDPLAGRAHRLSDVLGMPRYLVGNLEATYWDVHYVHVESVNLYANGRVSTDYPITRGHSEQGEVRPQTEFPGDRIRSQWVTVT